MCCCLSDSVRQGVPTAFAAILVSGKAPTSLTSRQFDTPHPACQPGPSGGAAPSPWQSRRPGPRKGSPATSAGPSADRLTGLGSALTLHSRCLLHVQTLKTTPRKLLKSILKNPFSRDLKLPEKCPASCPGWAAQSPAGTPAAARSDHVEEAGG